MLCQYWSEEMALMVGTKHYFRELSPWIQEKLNLFKNKNDVDLHVVAPNYASNTNVEQMKDGITFHFYHYSPTLLSISCVKILKLFVKHAEIYKISERLCNVLTHYRVPAKEASSIIRAIDPDLIHLYGSENSDYSAPAKELIDDYPILLTVQGYACLEKKGKNPLIRSFYNQRVAYEKYINSKVKYITVFQKTNVDQIKNNEMHYFYNCEFVFFVNVITKIPQIDASNIHKKYDTVFYARIDKNKGIEDLIDAIGLLKKERRIVSLLVMGRGSDDYISILKKRAEKLYVRDQIDFYGFVENHDEVYMRAAEAQLLVLPTHNDGIPNTIREAMFMKLPVVSTRVGGIPMFNQNQLCVHLVEKENVKKLADGIVKVLEDDVYRNQLIKNAFSEACDSYSPSSVYRQTIEAYYGVYEKAKIIRVKK